MVRDSNPRSTGSTVRSVATELLRWFGSLKLAVVLIVTLAVVLAGATFLETAKGREFAQWYVYHSRWFAALLALLAVNVSASAAIRFPWRKKHIGFLVTHGGILVLLAGSIETFRSGIEGTLAFEEGQTQDRIAITDRCQFTASWPGQAGARRNSRTIFVFQAGPVDWPEGKTLDVGALNGVGLEVLKFYRHARVQDSWIENPERSGSPAIQVVLAGSDGRAVWEEWLVADGANSQASLGPVTLEFRRAAESADLEAFLKPPATDVKKDAGRASHSTIEFLQAADGKLYCRVGRAGKYELRGAVAKGQPIELSTQFNIVVAEQLASARREMSVRPIELAPSENAGPEPAALVRVSAGGATQEVWLQRNRSEYRSRRLQTPEGVLEIDFGNEQFPLGFALRLERFERGMNPGRMGDASFASFVRLIDPHLQINEDREISMNAPLSHGKFSFYQSSFIEQPNGRSVSILSVAYDPGEFLKYLGSLMICLGILLTSFGRYQKFGKFAAYRDTRRETDGDSAGRRPSGPRKASPSELPKRTLENAREP